MRHRRGGKRNRERKTRRVVLRAEWHYRGRAVVVVEINRRGQVDVTTRVAFWRVDRVARELAANWLADYLPKLDHESRFSILWGYT